MRPAILLLEFDSIAVGIEAGDAMAKRAPLATLLAGTIHPGRYLVLAGGEVGDVEEARDAGAAVAAGFERDRVFLADVDSQVVEALRGGRRWSQDNALGILETRTVAAAIEAADAAVKGALVRLLEIRMADGLGGKGYVLLGGEVSAVEAAVDLGVGRLAGRDVVVASRVIAQLHEEMHANLAAQPTFLARLSSSGGTA